MAQQIFSVIRKPQPPEPPKTEQEAPVFYQAIGYLCGLLQEKEDGSYSLLTRHGDLLVSGVSGKLKRWLEHNPERRTGSFIVYPRTGEDGSIRSLFVQSLCNRAIDSVAEFQISGRVVYQKDGKIVLRVQRNVAIPTEQEKAVKNLPFKITVIGELSEFGIGQFWRISANVEDGVLTLVSGQKLAEAEKKPVGKSFKSSGDRPQRGKKTVTNRKTPTKPLLKRGLDSV